MDEVNSLHAILSQNTRVGELFDRMTHDWVLCYACGHRCKIPPGRDGICKVRFNKDGKLHVPWGYAGGVALDPIEKKPFFSCLPWNESAQFWHVGM